MTDDADEAGILSAGTVGVTMVTATSAPKSKIYLRIGSEEFEDGDIICFMNRGEARSRGVNGQLPDPPVLFVVAYDPKLLTVGLEQVSWEAAKRLAPEKMADVGRDLEKMRAIHGGNWLPPFKVFAI